jgi:hypothetical protein
MVKLSIPPPPGGGLGTWTDTYFSEELKAVQKLGYKITLIKGIEFDKTDLFSGYVKHFYDKKKIR